jgi:nicotinamide phosphoribosyltransferase
MNKRYGLIFDTDSYKNSHHRQYPPGTKEVFSYIESRGGRFDKTVFFGLQYYIKEYLLEPTTMKDVERAAPMWTAHMGSFNYGWRDDIVKAHDGYYPVRIRALPEGLVVPTSTPLVTVQSLDGVIWANTWMETSLMRNVWPGTDVASISYNGKKIIRTALEKSCDSPDTEINFKLHDFGGRGVSSQESAMVGGAAHLINFMGTDTFVSIPFLADYYNQSEMPGYSIDAMEHSSVTSWGKEHEADAFRNMLRVSGKAGVPVACVSDSYDIKNAVQNIWCKELKDDVIKSGAIVVIRPDSGNPPEIVLMCVKLLDEGFGHTVNNKGYKVLKHTRVIQGDGINLDMIQKILDVLLEAGYSAENVAFGMGGALLQQHNRDTQKFAMKCSHIYRARNGMETEKSRIYKMNGEELVSVDVFKDPITDPGKRSKAGRLDVIRDDRGEIKTVVLEDGQIAHPRSIMRTVYETGRLLVDDSFAEIRKRAV